MLLVDFQNPVDEYFVALILRACLILILATFVSQGVVLLSLLIGNLFWTGRTKIFKKIAYFLGAFPAVDIGIFSVAIFFTSPMLEEWVWIIAAFLLIPTIVYWIDFLKGPVRNLFAFAKFHQVDLPKINKVLAPFYVESFTEFFAAVLKRHLMPLVFVLVVMDFRIILPRLVEQGLSYQAFALFLSLIISLHLISYKQERA